MGSPRVDQKTSEMKLPAWFEAASQWNIDQGRNLAGRDYTPYEGERMAEFNPLQNQAFNTANYYGNMAPGAFQNAYSLLNDTTGQGMMQGAYGQAQGLLGMNPDLGQMPDYQGSDAWFGQFHGADNAYGQATTADAVQSDAMFGDRSQIQDVQGGSFLDMDRSAYMNDYTDNVINDVGSDFMRFSDLQQGQNAGQAAKAGAFGGSRHGVQDAITESETERNFGQLANQMRSEAFDNASGLMGQDLARGLQASGMNQGMDATMQQLNANLGTQNNQFNANALNNMGQFNAGLLSDMSQFNAGQAQQGNQFNANNANLMSQFNAGQGQQNDQFNAGNQLQSDYYNMMGGLDAFGQQSGLLGTMANIGQAMGNQNLAQGQALQGFGESGMGSQAQAGDQIQGRDQANLTSMYNDWLEARDWAANNFQYANAGMPSQVGNTTSQDVFSPNMLQQGIAAGTALGGAALGGKSSKHFKDVIGPTDVDEVAEKVLTMPLYDWEYTEFEAPCENDPVRMGPLAEDFGAAFTDNPEERMIEYQRHISALHATVQSLAKRIEELEGK